MGPRPHRIVAAVCAALGIRFTFTALLLGYATRSLFNEGAFASRVAASLEDPRVAGYVAEQVADAVIKSKPDLVGLRPILVGVGRSVVTTPPFRAAVRRSARLVHHAILADFRDLSGYQVYACGSAAMVEAAHPAFKAQGLGPDDCFSDAFTPRAAPELARLGGTA